MQQNSTSDIPTADAKHRSMSASEGTAGPPSRRGILRSALALGAATPLAACTTLNMEPTGGEATGNPGQPERLATTSAHSLFTLPEDHKWHAAGIYNGGLLEEWHYWTGYVTDQDTGEELGLFYNVFNEGVSPGQTQRRFFFSLGNLKTHDFVWTERTLPGPLTATAPPGSDSLNDFLYSAQGENTSFTTIHRAKADIWSLRFTSVTTNTHAKINMNVELRTHTPYGYISMTPYGVENENTPWTGQADPQTMSSLSYYYGAPKQNITGTITIGNRTRRISGSMWFEHQWGNFSIAKFPWVAAYVWSALQFNDGSIFTYRQWYDQKNKPLLNIGRYVYATPSGGPSYGFGEAVQFEPLKTWKSPVSGRNYPVYARLRTPYGTWYYTPIFESYEMPFGYPPYGTGGHTIYEGASWIRKDSLTGPIIGKAFLELPNSLTETFPVLS